MAWANQEIRKLLSLLSKPTALEKHALAVQLKQALGAASARDALLQVIEQAFAVRTPLNDALRESIFRCDLEGKKSLGAADAMGVSPRTLFRWRAAAITAIASAVDQALQAKDSEAQFKYAIARMIAPVESTTAANLLEREATTIGSRAAYDAVCAALRNGREVSEALVERCTDQWRLLAQLEIARTNLVRGNPADYEKMRAQIRAALDRAPGVSYDRVEYELAYTDRLNAVRLCDVTATGVASRRMVETAGGDPELVALALVCEAEQACDESDFAKAETLIRKLESLSVRMGDFRVMARTSHVAAILQFLRGRYAEAIELAEATTAALRQVEPEFAACSAGNAGRAALFVGQGWKRPAELCSRFPQSYVTGYVDAVWARHLACTDPEQALVVIDRTIGITSDQQAWGVLTYARATRAMILDLLREHHAAQAERVWAWEKAVQVRRAFYLHDLFVHPLSTTRTHGPFELDERFQRAIAQRLATWCETVFDAEVLSLLQQAAVSCLQPAEHAGTAKNAVTPRLLRRSFGRLTQTERRTIEQCTPLLAADLALCLAPSDRPRFVEQYSEAFLVLAGGNAAQPSQPLVQGSR